MENLNKQGSVLGGALLVAGTTIGGGMLALPVLTSPGGFIPSLVLYVICWLFMTLTGLLFLELSLQMEEGANIVTMAKRTLGLPGKAIAWVLYLFLFYCLTIAYIVGCGDIVSQVFNGYIPRSFGPLVFVLLFSPFIYGGAKLVSKFNFFLMLSLGALYCGFVLIGLPFVETSNLLRSNWNLSLMALPIAFISFAYQGIVPTLVTYLHHDRKKISKSIWIGTLIPLVTYIVWQWLILGIIPFSGPNGLEETLEKGYNAVYPLKNHLAIPYIYTLGQYFAFFALLTSFYGVALGLKDFLADGLKIKKTPKGKLLLLAMICIPPLAVAMNYPGIFLSALDLAGGYGSALLLGLLPIIMVAKWRYEHQEAPQIVKGGNLVLAILAAFVICEVGIEVYKLFT